MCKLKYLLTVFFICFFSVVFGQIPGLPSNMGNIRSTDVSEVQINQIVAYMRQNNVTDQQAYDLLISRGMAVSEASGLRERIRMALNTSVNPTNSNSLNANSANTTNSSGRQSVVDTVQRTIKVQNPKRIFGLEIFNNGVISMAPNLQIATPVGYVIGPGDEININIYGYQEARYTPTVSPEGDVNIPYVGPVYVAGLTIEQATAKIKNKLASSGYANIRTGLTKVSVSVGRIRSIKVTILGEVVSPGSYTLPSLATAFNALYLSGGPNDIGSMRNIQIIRSGKVVKVLDIYDFLIQGNESGNVMLRDQDVIRVPPYDIRVALEGEVKRPGLFEVLKGETLEKLLNFAGGFSDSAYTAAITAYTSTNTERRISDITEAEFQKYTPKRSETFLVKKLINRFVNKVSITGQIYLPGDYELREGMTVKDLIVKAQGLKEEAFQQRGLILRQGLNLIPEYISFNPLTVINGAGQNITLERNDQVVISSVFDLKENQSVTVSGEVRNQGAFPYVKNMSLKDLVLMAGGFTDAAVPQKIEVARRVTLDSFNVGNVTIAEVLEVSSITDLEKNGNDIILRPFDAVIIRRNPGYTIQQVVRIEGEVVYPGNYVIQNKNERISDLIKRAGGLTKEAYEEGGYVSRKNNKTEVSRVNLEKINRMQTALNDTSSNETLQVERTVDQMAIDLSSILLSPGSKNDLLLEEGDVITVPKEKMDVRISGQVLFPTRVVFNKKLDLKDYISRAGGTTDNARQSKIYVLYANGDAARTKSFLFIRSYPRVTPGAEVIVPKKHEVERRRLSTGEVIGISTALAALGGVLIQLLK